MACTKQSTAHRDGVAGSAARKGAKLHAQPKQFTGAVGSAAPKTARYDGWGLNGSLLRAEELLSVREAVHQVTGCISERQWTGRDG